MVGARVSDSELRELVEAKDGERLSGFCDDAHTLVEEVLASSSLSEGRKKLIEKNLAAHFWVVAKEKGGVTMERVGDAQNMYQTIKGDGTGLASTRFGQQVLALDDSGQLNQVLTYTKKAQLRVV